VARPTPCLRLACPRAIAAALVALLAASGAAADVFDAPPGSGTITAALAKAKDGDTVRLAAGEYTDAVELPDGVSLQGPGPDQTTLTATSYAAVNCKGPHITIAGLTIKPGEKTVRGVNTSSPVRVERCRFVGVKEGVAMMGAPLSDVVACEFIDCGIGVRAIGGASPTVWGCLFKGGNMGVFAMDGMPYVRNNVFTGQKLGVKMMMKESEQPILRNNLFLSCEDAGIEVTAKNPIFRPSIRNTIFDRCGVAVRADAALVASTSHCVVHECGEAPFHDKAGVATLKVGDQATVAADTGVTVDAGGQVAAAHPELLDGKGVRSSEQAEGQSGQIGPEAEWRQVGCAAAAPLPAVRFKPPLLIANAVAEEYQYFRLRGLAMSKQSTGKQDGKQVDRVTCSQAGKPLELVFDISRFFGEMSIKP
jgi:hypothetical protein